MKVREYQAVASIRRYLIVEQDSVGLTVFERATAEDGWQAEALTTQDILKVPELAIEVSVIALYQDVGPASAASPCP